MKIFFVKKRPCGKIFSRIVGTMLPVGIVAIVLLSQLNMLGKEKLTPTSAEVVQSDTNSTLVLESDVSFDEGKVRVLKDGEWVTSFSGNKAYVSVSGTNVIEVYSEDDKEFNVNFHGADGMVFADDKRTVKCGKGISMICRVTLNSPDGKQN